MVKLEENAETKRICPESKNNSFIENLQKSVEDWVLGVLEMQNLEKAEKLKILADLKKAYKNQDMETYNRLEKYALEKYQGQEYAENFHKTLDANSLNPTQYMIESKLDELSYDKLCNMYFRFTTKEKLTENFIEGKKGIAEEWAVATRGDWEVPEDDRNNPRVFYVQGIEAVLIRLEITDTQTYLKGLLNKGENSPDIQKDILKYKNSHNEEQKEQIYAKKYEWLKDGVLLVIDESVLNTNLDDEVKKMLGDNYPAELHKALYENVTNEMHGKKPEFNPNNKEQFLKQHKWDMSTAVGQSIAPENLSIASINGKTSTLDIFKFICKMVEKWNPKFYEQLGDVREFMQYIEKHEKAEATGELGEVSK